MARVAYLYGKRLAAERERRSLTQRELGEAIGGVSDETISRVERHEVAGILAKRLPKLAVTLGFTLEEFKTRFEVNDKDVPVKKVGGLPGGLNMRKFRPAVVVPEYAIGVAANRRVEKLAEHPDANRIVDSRDKRAFAVPVDGDCQTPKWKDGEVVVFSYDAVEREGVLPGKSYYVAFTDGSTTFKRVFLDEKDPETFILRCWNRKKYPSDHRVHASEVVRIARAVAKQLTVDEEE